jgi:myo-inositol-1(or 4)-monophosphatase
MSNKLDSLPLHLEALFQAIVQAVTTGNPNRWTKLGQNAKGDQVKWFDLAADEAVCAYLMGQFPCSVELLSEEGEPRSFGSGQPEWILVLDPVDGSDNFSRGLSPTAVALALIPAGQPLALETVEYALVGDLHRRTIWQAARRRGAFCNDQRLQPSPISQLAQAMLSCDLNQTLIQPALAGLLAGARAVRVFGSAATTLTWVADGTVDAYIDVRHCLTPENFLAPALLITEAGGLISGLTGQPLPVISSLTEGFSVVAAGNPELHAAILQQMG